MKFKPVVRRSVASSNVYSPSVGFSARPPLGDGENKAATLMHLQPVR
jgi:hypothetical protein